MACPLTVVVPFTVMATTAGAALAAALRYKDSLTAVLFGVATGSILHAVAHWMDRDLGGKSSDPWLISVLAAAVTVAAFIRAGETDRG
jgi:hypothetical protein